MNVMETFELDSNRTSSLERMIQMNFFEYSLDNLEVELLQNFDVFKNWWSKRDVVYL